MANGILINQTVSLNEDSILEALGANDENGIDVIRISKEQNNDDFTYTVPLAFSPSAN